MNRTIYYVLLRAGTNRKRQPILIFLIFEWCVRQAKKFMTLKKEKKNLPRNCTKKKFCKFFYYFTDLSLDYIPTYQLQ